MVKLAHFLKVVLEAQPESKETEEELLALKLIVLFVLKRNATKLWTRLKLDTTWKQTLVGLKRSVHALGLTFVELHPKLDAWYFTKEEGCGDEFQPNPLFMQACMDKARLDRVDSPHDAVVVYTYLRMLAHCNPFLYEPVLRARSEKLEALCKTNPEIWGYYLTHVILYNVRFTRLRTQVHTPNGSTMRAFRELNTLCEKHMKGLSLDLRGEITLCCKLCPMVPFPALKVLRASLQPVPATIDLHERAVLTLAFCPFDDD